MLDRKTELPVLMIGSPKALTSLSLHGTVKVTLQMLSTQQMCVLLGNSVLLEVNQEKMEWKMVQPLSLTPLCPGISLWSVACLFVFPVF